MRKSKEAPTVIDAPLYVQITEALRARIFDGTYAPGDKLPTEQALCDTFGVSRITVRQALEQLRREGAVHKTHGQGTFVSAPRAFQNVSALESFTEAMAPLGHNVANRLEGFQYIKAGESIGTRLGIAGDERIAEIKRVRLLDGTAVSFEVTYVAEALGRHLASADLSSRDIFHVIEQDGGIRIGYANVAIDAIPADEETAAALQVRRDTSVLRIERHVWDTENRPVLFEKLHFRGDAFQYRMRVDRTNVTRPNAAKPQAARPDTTRTNALRPDAAPPAGTRGRTRASKANK